MCKQHVPTIEERRTAWVNTFGSSSDELSLISSSIVYPDSAASDKKRVSRIAWMCRYKMNQGVSKEEEKEPTVDDLLLDGITEEFPGEECVIKGLRRPNDNTLRHLRDSRAKFRHMREMKTVGGYDPICRGENGKTHFDNSEEWEAAIVATKEKHNPCDFGYWRRVDRRKSRRNGKAECREIPEYIADDAEEENREFFPEKADGTIDVDFCLRNNWLYADLDDGIYGAEYDDDDWDDDYDEDDEEEESYEEYLEGENFRLKREISTYKDFLGEFNLGKLYQTWLAQNGKGEGK